MEPKTDEVVEQAIVREVAGVVRTPEVLEKIVEALELAGFDRADIDVMADVETIRKRFGTVFVPLEEFADVPGAPRRAFVHRDDISWRASRPRSPSCSRSAPTVATLGVVASGGAWPPLSQRPPRPERRVAAWAPSPPVPRKRAGEADRDHDHGGRSRCLGAGAAEEAERLSGADHARWRRRGGSRPRNYARQASERPSARQSVAAARIGLASFAVVSQPVRT